MKPIITAILLPGLDGTGELFTPLIAAAPRRVSTITVTYPVNETSNAVLERLAREKLTNRCIVIAESFSGPIGARVAMDDRVQALILCNSFVSSPMSSALRHFVFAPIFKIPIPKFALRFFLLGREAGPTLVRSAQSALRRVPGRVVAHRVRQVLQPTNGVRFVLFTSRFFICAVSAIISCRNAAGGNFRNSPKRRDRQDFWSSHAASGIACRMLARNSEVRRAIRCGLTKRYAGGPPKSHGRHAIPYGGAVKQILKMTLIAVMQLLLASACRQGSQSSPATSPPASPPVTNENVVEMLSRREQDWAEANVNPDETFQDGILADDYIVTTEDGSTANQGSVD